MLLMRWCCWCTDAADPLMLLNQDQDLLADLCKAICSSLTNWRPGRWGIWRIWSATRRGRLSSPRWEWGRGWQLSWPAWSPLSHLQTPPGHYDNNLLFLVFRRMILHGSTWSPLVIAPCHHSTSREDFVIFLSCAQKHSGCWMFASPEQTNEFVKRL